MIMIMKKHQWKWIDKDGDEHNNDDELGDDGVHGCGGEQLADWGLEMEWNVVGYGVFMRFLVFRFLP